VANDAATYDMARTISWSIFKSFGLSIALAVPFCIAAGIALSFRFGGLCTGSTVSWESSRKGAGMSPAG